MEVNNKQLKSIVAQCDKYLEDCGYYSEICAICDQFSTDFPAYFGYHSSKRVNEVDQEEFEDMKERFVRHVNLVHLGYNRHNKQKAYS
jgi:hypothetical protein